MKVEQSQKKKEKGEILFEKYLIEFFLPTSAQICLWPEFIVVASLMFVLCYAMLHKCTTGKNLK